MARACLATFVTQRKVQSFEDMRKLQKSGTGIKGIDDSWPIESLLIDMVVGAATEEFAERRLTKIFPSATQHITLKDCETKLDDACNSTASKMAPDGVQKSQLYLKCAKALLQENPWMPARSEPMA